MPLDLSPKTKLRPAKFEGRTPKQVLVEYLYLDLQVCDRCIGTEQVLDEVITTLEPALKLAGLELKYQKIKVDSPELAHQYRFESSPTVRVNGQDVCSTVNENACDCCSDISGSLVDCRVFEYKGKTHEVPPKEMLAEAILRMVFGTQTTPCCDDIKFQLPENLKHFYLGKNEKSDCGCASSCC